MRTGSWSSDGSETWYRRLRLWSVATAGALMLLVIGLAEGGLLPWTVASPCVVAVMVVALALIWLPRLLRKK